MTAVREFCALEMEEVSKLTNTGRETECSDSLVYASIALGSVHDKHFDKAEKDGDSLSVIEYYFSVIRNGWRFTEVISGSPGVPLRRPVRPN